MSAHLLCGDTILRLPSARIAAKDVAEVRNAGVLLENAKTIRQDALEAAQTAEREGYERGREQALCEMRDALGDALATLSDQFAAENARRETHVARAAMHAVEQLIGACPDVEVVEGLARRALGQCDAGEREGGLRLYVAEEWVDTLAQRLGDNKHVAVSADPAADRFTCQVVAGEGRIIADLEPQLAKLRDRWGLSGEGTTL